MGRALVLAGGTALGAVQVYSMEQLMGLHGITGYSHVAGVSVGSVNGVMFAANKLPELRALWEKVKGTGFFMTPNIFGPAGLMTLKPLRRKLKRNVDLSDVVPSLTYSCGVTDFEADEYLNLPNTSFNDDDAFLDAITASASQPVIMRGWEVEIAGPGGAKHLCFDGGVKHVVPKLTDPHQYDAIDVILCNPPLKLQKLDEHDLDDIFEIFGRAFDIMVNENVLISDVERLQEWNEDGTPVTIYAPQKHDKEFDASHEAIMRRLDVVGPWMWNNPWTPDSFLQHWRNS